MLKIIIISILIIFGLILSGYFVEMCKITYKMKYKIGLVICTLVVLICMTITIISNYIK